MATISREGHVTPRRKGSGSVYQVKDGRWRGTIEAGWTSKGTRRRITVSAKTEREALRKLRDKERDIARIGLPAEGAGRTLTVKAWAEQWLSIRVTQVRQDGYTADRSAITTWIIPTIGHIRLERLSATHVRQVIDKVSAKRAASTAVRTHSVLRQCLKAALAEGHTIPPSVFAVPPPKLGESPREDIPLPHARLILATALKRDDASRWFAAFLQGLRPAEARGLTWDALDLDELTMDVSWQLKALRYNTPRDRSSGFRIPADHEVRHLVDAWHLVRPKTAAGKRIIPLVDPMPELLTSWKASSPASPYGLVWPGLGGRPKKDPEDQADWKSLIEMAGVAREDRAYDLYEARHTTGTLLSSLNVPEPVIIRIMGHSSMISTKAYIHASLDESRVALEQVSTKLLEIA
nr:tyrosine-type recombinase/integrase [Flaviflexus equikiangi]